MRSLYSMIGVMGCIGLAISSGISPSMLEAPAPAPMQADRVDSFSDRFVALPYRSTIKFAGKFYNDHGARCSRPLAERKVRREKHRRLVLQRRRAA